MARRLASTFARAALSHNIQKDVTGLPATGHGASDCTDTNPFHLGVQGLGFGLQGLSRDIYLKCLLLLNIFFSFLFLKIQKHDNGKVMSDPHVACSGDHENFRII